MAKNIKNKGITLIALAITVVVLLILVGVTISQVTENGMFNISNTAKDNANKSEEKEILNTSAISAISKSSKAKVEETHLKTYLDKNVGEEGKDYTIKRADDNSKNFEIKFIKTEHKYVILEDGTVLEKDEYQGTITTDSNEVIIIEVGTSKEITVDTSGTKEPVTWSSSNDAVAKVRVEDVTNTKTAKIDGISNGENIIITAKLYNGQSKRRKVTVQTSPSAVKINDVEVDIGDGQKTKKIEARIEPETANVNRELTWTSSDPNIVTVDDSGNVTGKAMGSAIITVVTKNGKKDTCTVSVHATPKSIKINPATVTLDRSGTNTQKLTVSYEPSYSDRQTSITWRSYDTNIVTVDASGNITGKANGETKIEAKTANGKIATCIVTVHTTPKSISLDPNNLILDMSGTTTRKLTVKFDPTDVDQQNTITWSSNRESVATVDNFGNVTAKSNGDAIITAKTANGKIATCNVHVQTSLKSIALNRTSLGLDLSGTKTGKLTVSYNPTGANVNTGIMWSSSNNNVATVDNSGNVTAKANGGAIITAKAQNGSTATCSVGVQTTITSISINEQNKSINLNQTLQLTANVNPSSTSEKLQWISSNTNVATVDSNGLVRPKTGGTVTITVKGSTSGKSATCQVTVINYMIVNLDQHYHDGAGTMSPWSGTIAAGATRAEVSMWGKLINGWRDKDFVWTYSGNGSASWKKRLDGSFGNNPSYSSTQYITLNGGTSWNITLVIKKVGMFNGSPDCYSAGSIKFYY